MLLVRLDVRGDQTLLLGDTPLLCLAVDGGEALVAPRLLAALDQDKHVLPVGVDDGLGVKGTLKQLLKLLARRKKKGFCIIVMQF